jgi:hypothetical protein
LGVSVATLLLVAGLVTWIFRAAWRRLPRRAREAAA